MKIKNKNVLIIIIVIILIVLFFLLYSSHKNIESFAAKAAPKPSPTPKPTTTKLPKCPKGGDRNVDQNNPNLCAVNVKDICPKDYKYNTELKKCVDYTRDDCPQFGSLKASNDTYYSIYNKGYNGYCQYPTVVPNYLSGKPLKYYKEYIKTAGRCGNSLCAKPTCKKGYFDDVVHSCVTTINHTCPKGYKPALNDSDPDLPYWDNKTLCIQEK
jgi:hypothetical protein